MITEEVCESCQGDGFHVVDGFDPSTAYGHVQHEEICTDCEGSGYVEVERESTTTAIGSLTVYYWLTSRGIEVEYMEQAGQVYEATEEEMEEIVAVLEEVNS